MQYVYIYVYLRFIVYAVILTGKLANKLHRNPSAHHTRIGVYYYCACDAHMCTYRNRRIMSCVCVNGLTAGKVNMNTKLRAVFV